MSIREWIVEAFRSPAETLRLQTLAQAQLAERNVLRRKCEDRTLQIGRLCSELKDAKAEISRLQTRCNSQQKRITRALDHLTLVAKWDHEVEPDPSNEAARAYE